MKSPRKYDSTLIAKIVKSINDGLSIREASDKFSIDRRRIAEFLKKTPQSSQKQPFKEFCKEKGENEANISSTTFSDLSIEDILSKNGYNPDEWEVTNFQKNTWDDTSGKTHYQTKLNVVKKKLDIRYSTPTPISISLSKSKNKYASESAIRKSSTIKCALILPDMQCGFRRNMSNGSLTSIHDRRAMDVALQIANYLNPDRIVLLGDNLDLAEMSTKYLTTPDFYFTTQASLVELSWWLAKLRLINNNSEIDYIAGNHEKRLEKYINEKTLSSYGLKNVSDLKGPPAMSIEKLLALDDLDIKYHQYPAGRVAINSNLVCIHGEVAKGGSGATVSEVVKSARVSTIQGHIHRHEIATKTTWDAYDNYHMYTAASFGCLCKIDPGVVPGMLHRQNWQQGVGVVWYEEGGLEQFRMEFIPIIDGRAIYTDEIFEARDEQTITSRIESEMKFKVT